LDLSAIDAPAEVTLVLALVGGDGDTTSAVRIDNVVLDETPNSPPIADAGDDVNYPCGADEPIVLNGSASSDPDGQALSWKWLDPQGTVVGTTPTVQVSPQPGTHVYTLEVTDPFGAKGTDTVTVLLGTSDIGCSCLLLSGDVNGDGKVNVTDVQCIIVTALWELVGSDPNEPDCLAGPPQIADLDCVAPVTVTDVSLNIFNALGVAYPPSIDADGDGCPDTCNP
jgi:hypothetical protein